MNLRDLIDQTRSLADVAAGRPIAILGKGLVVVGFGQTIDAWEAGYQAYLARQMADIAEKMPVVQKQSLAQSPSRSPVSKHARSLDF